MQLTFLLRSRVSPNIPIATNGELRISRPQGLKLRSHQVYHMKESGQFDTVAGCCGPSTECARTPWCHLVYCADNRRYPLQRASEGFRGTSQRTGSETCQRLERNIYIAPIVSQSFKSAGCNTGKKTRQLIVPANISYPCPPLSQLRK